MSSHSRDLAWQAAVVHVLGLNLCSSQHQVYSRPVLARVCNPPLIRRSTESLPTDAMSQWVRILHNREFEPHR